MPRQAREKSSSGIYHVMLRGINKQNIFEDDEDREKILKTIRHYKGISNFELYGYCLMDNHIHLLLKEIEESISDVVKRISSGYVYWYNQKYTRCGHLFQERFKSEAVESDVYFLTALRYIHQNPIKAGIIKNIQEYLWSSYSEYIGVPTYTDIDFALKIFSSDEIEAKKLYRNYMKKKSNDECMEYYEKTNISDKEVIDCFNELGINNISELQRLGKEQRDEVIGKVKRIKNIPVRQLARITGISKSVIQRS